MTSVVLVTGSSGYIGGQTALKLKDAGYTVIGIDRRPPPEHLKSVVDHWCIADFASVIGLEFIELYKPMAIIHCAGTSLVGPSITNPKEYYDNNVFKTYQLLNFLVDRMPRTRVIFSSSAATYGTPIMIPCQEVDPTAPISPYGESKLMTEMILNSYNKAYGLDTVSFRYFNACGADSQQRHGSESNTTHIIARVLESLRDDKEFTLNGTNYPTPDGSCIRDYIHVEDLADAHIRALDVGIPSGVYNLGNSKGISNLEVIACATQITGKTLRVIHGPARPGDPESLTANSDKFTKVSGWKPKFGLNDIISHAWSWYNR